MVAASSETSNRYMVATAKRGIELNFSAIFQEQQEQEQEEEEEEERIYLLRR